MVKFQMRKLFLANSVGSTIDFIVEFVKEFRAFRWFL